MRGQLIIEKGETLPSLFYNLALLTERLNEEDEELLPAGDVQGSEEEPGGGGCLRRRYWMRAIAPGAQ